MLARAAHQGAQLAIEGMLCYRYKDVCKRLNTSYNALSKRLLEGTKPIAGKITGAELRLYLDLK